MAKRNHRGRSVRTTARAFGSRSRRPLGRSFDPPDMHAEPGKIEIRWTTVRSGSCRAAWRSQRPGPRFWSTIAVPPGEFIGPTRHARRTWKNRDLLDNGSARLVPCCVAVAHLRQRRTSIHTTSVPTCRDPRGAMARQLHPAGEYMIGAWRFSSIESPRYNGWRRATNSGPAHASACTDFHGGCRPRASRRHAHGAGTARPLPGADPQA
jgi:hypothetical protein